MPPLLTEPSNPERQNHLAASITRRFLFVRVVLRAGLLGVLSALSAWSAAALWIDEPVSRQWAGLLAGGFLITSGVLLLGVERFRNGVSTVLGMVVVVMIWWFSIPARNDRD